MVSGAIFGGGPQGGPDCAGSPLSHEKAGRNRADRRQSLEQEARREEVVRLLGLEPRAQ